MGTNVRSVTEGGLWDTSLGDLKKKKQPVILHLDRAILTHPYQNGSLWVADRIFQTFSELQLPQEVWGRGCRKHLETTHI